MHLFVTLAAVARQGVDVIGSVLQRHYRRLHPGSRAGACAIIVASSLLLNGVSAGAGSVKFLTGSIVALDELDQLFSKHALLLLAMLASCLRKFNQTLQRLIWHLPAHGWCSSGMSLPHFACFCKYRASMPRALACICPACLATWLLAGREWRIVACYAVSSCAEHYVQAAKEPARPSLIYAPASHRWATLPVSNEARVAQNPEAVSPTSLETLPGLCL